MTQTTTWLGDRARRLPPLAILGVGWLGVVLYANPGYLTDESIHALAEARIGHYRDLATVIWRIVDFVVPGPFGMLVVQATCFVAGAYLVLRRAMPPRWAAGFAVLVLWFPPISGTLAVIWSEPHAVGWLVLGAGWLGCAGRSRQILGLVALALGAAMVPGGWLVCLPLVLGLARFAEPDGRPRWRRFAIAAAAWLAVALVALGLGSRFADPRAAETAQLDIAGTVHYSATVGDDDLRAAFAATSAAGLDGVARGAYNPARSVPELRAAVAAALGVVPAAAARHSRDTIVAAHRGAYLSYRWNLFRKLIELDNRPAGSQAHTWFTDTPGRIASAELIQHAAAPSGLQTVAQPAMSWLGTTALFVPYVYLLLAIVLLPLSLRHRRAAGLIGSGLVSALVGFWAGSDPAFRASLWLAVTSVLAAVLLFVERAVREPADEAAK